MEIFGSVDADANLAIQRLRKRNIGIVIRDESELNIMRIEAEKKKQKQSVCAKGKGKGKENEAPRLVQAKQSKESHSALAHGKEKEMEVPEVAPCDNQISNRALAQRRRRERERDRAQQLPPTPQHCVSHGQCTKRSRLAQTPLAQVADKLLVPLAYNSMVLKTPNPHDYSLRRISPLTDSLFVNQVPVQLPQVVLPRNLHQDFVNERCVIEQAKHIVARALLASSVSGINQDTSHQHIDLNIAEKYQQAIEPLPFQSRDLRVDSLCPPINRSTLPHFGKDASTSTEGQTSVQIGRHFLGHMNVKCPHCLALHWMDERLTNSSMVRPLFGKCCKQGQVQLPPLIEPPPEIKLLFDGNDDQSKSFRSKIREYNAANAFTSLGVQMDDRVLIGKGTVSFTIYGELRHRIGALLPEPGLEPYGTYAQLYIYDPDVALDIRERKNTNLRRDVLHIIQDCMEVNNAFTSKYCQAFAILKKSNEAGHSLPAYLHYNSAADRRRYNLPTSDEIAVILPGDGSEVSGMRDIIVRFKGGDRLMQISECHPAYLPLHYVLLFPHGQLGWHPELKLWDVKQHREQDKRLTQLHYYGYRLFQHGVEYSTVLRGQKLFQEFIVDAWASTEQNRLTYYRLNQGTLRAELYKDLVSCMSDGFKPDHVGKRMILPSSFTGSARNMFEIYQDSMAITRFNQHPDIFLTMTANPRWLEITNELLPYQKAVDRPDLVARVFELKRNALMKEIEKKNVFGKKVAHVFTIEFQKRGLPHMHTLIFLESQSKIRTCAQVDKIVCAEFPDPDEDPILFETILGCMVHGPCGSKSPQAPCMENGRCTKKYPRDFTETTTMDKDGYPVYRRRNDGREYITAKGKIVDNRNVVPYNPYLSRMFNCHINVEVCARLRCVKYINKYIYKGHDRTTMVLGGVDEIQQYLDARYIGPPEAAWRVFGNPMHEEKPSVTRLDLHLPGMHHVVFNPVESVDRIISRAAVQMTTLTAFFEYCSMNEDARAYTYQEFPQHFVWNKTSRIWTPRKVDVFAIGRMYFASPNEGERFYLRLLLTVVKGPTSFEFLRTVNNVLYDTFKAACVARGLLEDDNEWVQCLQEAAVMRTGYQLRRLFSIILTQCFPLHPDLLWNQFAMHICDDLAHKLRTLFNIQSPKESQVEDYGLYLLNELLHESGKSLTDFPPMLQPIENWSICAGNRLIWEHRQLQIDAEQADAQSNVDRLNEGQRNAYSVITSSVFENNGTTFFLNGGAGTGKTFLYNTVATKCRSLGYVVITVASSGIASLLLVGGRTAHSTFRIPLDILENSNCGFTKQSIHAELFKLAKLIIWDEVPMQHRHGVEAVNRTLQDICNNNKPFGGITVVLGGDFRQILPVIPKGVREEIVAASLRRSVLWKNIQVLTLSLNMRLNASEHESLQFSMFLNEVGMNPKETVKLPSSIRKCQIIEHLLSTVYPLLNVEGIVTMSFLNERTILSARNDDVSAINSAALNQFPGEIITYFGADKLCTDETNHVPNNQYPNEFLNALNPSGLPLFKLDLKVGCPIMLLRNIAPKDGLCNGTRLIITKCADHVIEAKILTGDKFGNSVFIPRISLTPSSSEIPIKMTRRQFPVRLAYAMTMNKSQGQSVKFVGIDLRTAVFSHGQLYVALSRCTSANRISVLLPDDILDSTSNIVYPKVLL